MKSCIRSVVHSTFASLAISVVLLSTLAVATAAEALTLKVAVDAATAAGYPAKDVPAKGSYSVSKEPWAKKTFKFKTFGKGSKVDQIELNCEQCEGPKLDTKTPVLCYEDIQKIAKKTHIDMPLDVIDFFDEIKAPVKSWKLAGHIGKSLRFEKTKVKCTAAQTGAGSMTTEGIRFDFFYQ